jgi:hypothetical protein
MSLAGCLLISFVFIISACKKNSSGGPRANPISPDSAAGNATLYVTGSGLSGITSITFSNDSVPAPFNGNFNTDGAIIFRVPDSAFGGPQNIIFTNKSGQTFTLPFNVLAFPMLASASNYDFNDGDTITLTGSNFETVTSVSYLGTAIQAKILSESHHTLQIVMPATTLPITPLVITNPTGSDTTTQQFVSIANAYVIFANGNYGSSAIQNGSWGPATIANAPVPLTRYPSFAATYDGGNYSADGFAAYNPPYLPNSGYTYFSFWVYGSSVAYTYYITASAAKAGYGNADVSNPIVIPPNTWTYFLLPIQQLGIFANTAANNEQIGWYIQGPPSGTNVTLYFDDVLFIK